MPPHVNYHLLCRSLNLSANLHSLGPRRTRSSAGAHRYFFRFDPILSPPSNDCSHHPPTDSSRLTNVLSVCSLQYTYIPSPLYLFTRLLFTLWKHKHGSRQKGQEQSRKRRERERERERVTKITVSTHTYMYNTNSKAGAGLPGHTSQRYNTLSRSHRIELPSCSSRASTLCVDVNAGSSMRIQRSSIVQRSSILHLLAVALPFVMVA